MPFVRFNSTVYRINRQSAERGEVAQWTNYVENWHTNPSPSPGSCRDKSRQQKFDSGHQVNLKMIQNNGFTSILDIIQNYVFG